MQLCRPKRGELYRKTGLRGKRGLGDAYLALGDASRYNRALIFQWGIRARMDRGLVSVGPRLGISRDYPFDGVGKLSFSDTQ